MIKSWLNGKGMDLQHWNNYKKHIIVYLTVKRQRLSNSCFKTIEVFGFVFV